jgi:hypothetical protein
VPQAVYGLSQRIDAAGVDAERLFIMRPLHRLAATLEGAGIGANSRQFNVGRSDAYWRSLIEFVRQHDPERTIVLATPNGPGSFRHLTYYMPNYRVYGFGWDLQRRYGHLFTAHAGTSDYAVEGLRNARQVVPLPPDVSWLVIPDWEVQIRLEDLPTTEVQLESGMKVVVVPVEPGATLLVEDLENRWAVLRIAASVDQE